MLPTVSVPYGGDDLRNRKFVTLAGNRLGLVDPRFSVNGGAI